MGRIALIDDGCVHRDPIGFLVSTDDGRTRRASSVRLFVCLCVRVFAANQPTMDGSLANLARAQDEFRNAVSVGLSEIKSAYETVVKDSATEHKGREEERERARRTIETAENDKEKLETKLTQCEEALKETKNVLMETREQAKDVRVECDRLIF